MKWLNLIHTLIVYSFVQVVIYLFKNYKSWKFECAIKVLCKTKTLWTPCLSASACWMQRKDSPPTHPKKPPKNHGELCRSLCDSFKQVQLLFWHKFPPCHSSIKRYVPISHHWLVQQSLHLNLLIRISFFITQIFSSTCFAVKASDLACILIYWKGLKNCDCTARATTKDIIEMVIISKGPALINKRNLARMTNIL